MLALAALLVVTRVEAHDFWIEPRTFRPAPGIEVPLRLFVGQDFKGDSMPYFPPGFERYVAVGPNGTQPVPGVLGDDPAGAVTFAAPGFYIIGLHTKPYAVTFDTAEEFERYLVKEGLERNLALHNRRKSLRREVEETYFRCAKSLIAVGTPPGDAAADRALGFPLELIADTNPYRAPILRLRLLHRGKPLQEALVIAFNRADPLAKLRARTDENGRVEFNLARSGVWLVTSVHMVPAPLLSGHDWNSTWASITFERP